MSLLTLVFLVTASLGLLVIIFGSIFTVPQQEVAIVERFGKFLHTAEAGLNFKIPLIDSIRSLVSLQIEQLDIVVETKTKDNVFTKVKASIQIYVIPEKVADAFYKLSKKTEQVSSYVFDVIRSEVPKLTLDQVFERKDDIAQAISSELKEQMSSFGYGILKSLVTDIDPDQKVKDAMNEINASTRLKTAAYEKAEAEKIKVVKAAEAEAESKELQGKGIAAQRQAIVDGLNKSVLNFMEGVPGSTSQDVMSLVLLTQYFDTLKDIGGSSRASTVFIPHSPSGMTDLSDQIRNAFMQADAGKVVNAFMQADAGKVVSEVKIKK